MSRILKRLGMGLVALLAVAGIAVAILYWVGSARLNRATAVAVAPVTVATDPEVLQKGAKLATLSACGDCHGRDHGGEVMIQGGPIGFLPAPNLTAGAGGIGASYTPEDWARAIRHGISADGRPILVMPSYHYAAYGDDDLGALIGFLQNLSPVDRELPNREISFPGTIIFGVMAYDDVSSVNKIDHAAVGGDAPQMGDTVEYGEYLVKLTGCASCHGADYTGVNHSNAPSGPSIRQSQGLAGWDRDDFAQTLRTGFTPDGRQLDTEMPWPSYTLLTDTEIDAVWRYFESLEQ